MGRNEQELNIFIMLYCHYRDRIIHQLAVEPAATCLDVLRAIEKSEFDWILFCIADIIIEFKNLNIGNEWIWLPG